MSNGHNTQQTSRVYKTSDITLAATLIEKGIRLIGIEPMAERRRSDICRFLFEDSDQRRELTMLYASRRIQVEPTAFMNNVRNLKQLVKEKRAETEGSDDASKDG